MKATVPWAANKVTLVSFKLNKGERRELASASQTCSELTTQASSPLRVLPHGWCCEGQRPHRTCLPGNVNDRGDSVIIAIQAQCTG